MGTTTTQQPVEIIAPTAFDRDSSAAIVNVNVRQIPLVQQRSITLPALPPAPPPAPPPASTTVETSFAAPIDPNPEPAIKCTEVQSEIWCLLALLAAILDLSNVASASSIASEVGGIVDRPPMME